MTGRILHLQAGSTYVVYCQTNYILQILHVGSGLCTESVILQKYHSLKHVVSRIQGKQERPTENACHHTIYRLDRLDFTV